MEQKRLFVGNLPFGISEEELTTHFNGAGTVKSTRIIKDRETGRSKGFGFVEMDNQEEATSAIEQLDGSQLGGRPIRVSIAQEKEGGGGGRRPRRN
ncbi:MAG: RNA-binding protein [Bdellovibrionaceae bacterium]|nr:RNA-binding protein [Bdellovibrionales bacterium]MCB9083083.1 RNA-binding protein [Pseudobdellovibrionaceae bacterium]